MKILFVTSRLPYPPFGGDKLRVFNFIKYLSKNNSIHLISFIESEDELQFAEKMKDYCASVKTVLLKPSRSYLNCLLFSLTLMPFQVAYYRDGRMRDKIRNAVANLRFDGIYVHLIRMAQYAKDIKDVSRVLDLTDSLTLSLKRSLGFRSHLFFLFYFMEWMKVRFYEPRIMRSFDRCLLISEADLEPMGLPDKTGNVSIVANGVNLDYFKSSGYAYKPNKIVFIGNLHSFPNRDAVLYFCNEIFPAIKREIPETEFYIVGANPPEKIKRLADGKNIIVTGPVKDARPYLSDAAAMVCPIRVATGMQNKILEAMAMGLPIVSTQIAAQWMTGRENSCVQIADSAHEFSGKVLELMKNKGLRDKLSFDSRKIVEDSYDWEKNIRKLEDVFKEGLKGYA